MLTLICKFGVGIFLAIISFSFVMPCFFQVEIVIAFFSLCNIFSIIAGLAMSVLFRTIISGMWLVVDSAKVFLTAVICPCGSGCETSTTCKIRSHASTSSSVDLKASISCVGRERTKPTVSTRVYSLPSGV